MRGSDGEGCVPRDQLVPGRRYRVRFEDCCVEGEFTAVFVGPPVPAESYDDYNYENAKIDGGSFQWEAEEA